MAEENNPWQYWSFPTYPSHIDHVLISNELFDDYESSTSMCSTILIDDFLFNSWTNYDQYLSDHRPVAIRFNFYTLYWINYSVFPWISCSSSK